MRLRQTLQPCAGADHGYSNTTRLLAAQAAVSAAAGDAPMVSSSVPADPPVAAETAPHHRAQHVGPDADAMPADDDDWPDPQVL